MVIAYFQGEKEYLAYLLDKNFNNESVIRIT